MKNLLIKIWLLLGVFAVTSCDFDDFLDNPNEVTAESSDVNFLLNRIQTDFADFYRTTSQRGARVTRIWHQPTDTYEIAYQAVNQNATWQRAYANILNDSKNLKTLAEAGGFKRHLGIAQTIEAYVLMVLVDQFGDVPFSDALDPSEFNPKLDTDADVYSAALELLTTAKANFTDPVSLGVPNDFFYGGDYGKWERLANTLMLRYHLNLSLINKAGATQAIDALIAGGKLLQAGDDFVWRYGTSIADPVSVHPRYIDQFPNGGGHYQSVFFMWHLTEGKGSDDPRANYYFYRQVGENPTSDSEVRCVNEFPPNHYDLDMPWCMPGDRGYWGRDHLDNQGIPPDGLGRTLYGVFPVGAAFDIDEPVSISSSLRGAGGAGIEPIMLASYVDFMLAEVQIELKDNADAAKQAMAAGARSHINYVRSWSLTTAEAARINAFESDEDFMVRVDEYVDYIENEYGQVASKTDRLRIIAREYWISLYGNGNEAYNLYRRTGQPDGMQPGLIASFGNFPRTFFYPADLVNLNSAVDQKANLNRKVFWDNNPDGFID